MHLGNSTSAVLLLASGVLVRPGLAHAEAGGALGQHRVDAASEVGDGSPRVPPRAPYRLAHDTPLFLGIELAGSGVVALTLGFAAGSDRATCGWCGTNALDRSVRDALYTTNSRTPALASHIVAIGAAPLLALGAVVVPALGTDHSEYALHDGIKILDAFLVTQGFAGFTKRLAGRERPAFLYGRQLDTEYASSPSEAYRSFFSGDTASAFTFGAAGATVAYERGYWTAPIAAVSGAALGVATGTLRMVADMHWLTDVLAGAAVGTGVGMAMPLLLHPRLGPGGPEVALTPVVTSDAFGIVARGEL